MTEEQFDAAKILMHKISACEREIRDLGVNACPLSFMQDIYDRHKAELRACLEGEIARLKAELAAI